MLVIVENVSVLVVVVPLLYRRQTWIICSIPCSRVDSKGGGLILRYGLEYSQKREICLNCLSVSGVLVRHTPVYCVGIEIASNKDSVGRQDLSG